jgi:hypothetical protein
MKRWWIREQFTGETQSMFVGYADSYKQLWPGTVDAVTEVRLTDEFKVLALDRLPTMNPPRDSYHAVIDSDSPAITWAFDNVSADRASPARIGGKDLVPSDAGLIGDGGLVSSATDNPIIGDNGASWRLDNNPNSTILTTQDTTAADQTVLNATPEYAVELWFKFAAMPAATRNILAGPNSPGPTETYALQLSTTGTIQARALNGSATLHTATSAALQAGVWYHIVATVETGNLRLYINGAQVASTAWTGTFDNGGPTSEFILGDDSEATVDLSYDEVAVYKHGLAAGRVSAHYEAGSLRGFPVSQTPGLRLGAILDTVSSHAPRSIQPGVRAMTGSFMRGQDVLSEAKDSAKAENVDALLFTARDGTITFLAADHRSSAPYNTVQATFDDDGTDLPYHDLDVDFSEAFLFNEWHVTARDTLLASPTIQTASDATSINKYFKRTQSLTDIPINTDAQALTVAQAMLAKYKEPFTRIQAITLMTADPDVAEAVFRRDIGDRIRVFRTPPGGGTRIDQTSFIQSIQIDGAPGAPWVIRWGVSPV